MTGSTFEGAQGDSKGRYEVRGGPPWKPRGWSISQPWWYPATSSGFQVWQLWLSKFAALTSFVVTKGVPMSRRP
jgi:hypothetical protein